MIFEEHKLTQELSKSEPIKDYKTNVTGYLSVTYIDRLENLAKDLDRSRNSVIEEALLDLLKKYKRL